MAVRLDDWLLLMQHEYLRRFVADRGCAIKFVTADGPVLGDIEERVRGICRDRLLTVVKIDAAETRIHMIQDVFFAIARSIDWDGTAQKWVEALFRRSQYEWPRPGEAVPLAELAELYRVDESLLKQQVLQWLSGHLMNVRTLAHDFRSAMAHLCMRRLEPADAGVVSPVLEWLNGDLRRVGAVRHVPINAKIARHNARAMLRSLCHWVRLIGGRGFVVIIDLSQVSHRGRQGGLRYTAAAAMDTFEVLRQLIDDAENYEGLFLLVMTDETFIRDDNVTHGLAAYAALKERIYPDVHAREHENPLAPLVGIARGDGLGNPQATLTSPPNDMPYAPARVAIEALRAGVPNRTAVKLLGTSEQAILEQFISNLRSVDGASGDRVVKGQIIAGQFGAGKSHLLGYLAEKALDENCVVSIVPVSKETPLFDLERMYSAAIRNAEVARENADVIDVALRRLTARPQSYAAFENWARGQDSRLSPIFAAVLHLWRTQTLAPQDRYAIVRFLSGARLGVAKVRQWLRNAGGAELVRMFDLRPVKAADLAVHRVRFVAALFRAAGFAGWCVLLDEVELIARYSRLQRAKSYAELSRWLCLDDALGVPGIVSVCAITSDFADVVFDFRHDHTEVPLLLENRGRRDLKSAAVLGMAALRRDPYRLVPPTTDSMLEKLDKVRHLYRDSYDWLPPIGVGDQGAAGTTMRHHIKSCITAWDIERLYGTREEIAVEEVKPQYEEEPELQRGAEPVENAEGDEP